MNKELNLESKIEALLFFKGEAITLKKIGEIFNVNQEEIENALSNLISSKENTGLKIIRNGDEITLGTDPKASIFLEEMRKEELTKDLSKATLETLSIIFYRNSVSRSEIDYIRGVNSSFILRNLLIRGLIQKSLDKNDSRRYIYEPTLESLEFMGITNINELPNYNEVNEKLQKSLINQQIENE